MLISAKLQTFLDVLSTVEEISSVVVEEPTDLMMRQIGDSWGFVEKPTLFTIGTRDVTNTIKTLRVVLPFEAWSTFEKSMIPGLVAAANRAAFLEVKNESLPVFFMTPDNVESIQLMGHVIIPTNNSSANLAALIESFKQIPAVVNVLAYEIVDPEILSQAKCTEAVRINFDLSSLFETKIDEIGNTIYDMYGITLPKANYEDLDVHPSLITSVTEQIANLK